MEWLALVIPALIGVGILLYFKGKVIWWELAFIFFPTLLLITLLRMGMISHTTADTEYVGSFIVRVDHYDHWNEYIHKTCHYTTCSGGKVKTCVTHSYDCSYVKDHPEEWEATTNTGETFNISQGYYQQLITTWKMTPIFQEMNRNFHTIDGDGHFIQWNHVIETVQPVTHENSYSNKVKGSHSIFRLREVDEKKKKLYALHDYPLVDDIHQEAVLGDNSLPNKQYINQLNGYLGTSKQVRIFILFFDNQPREAGFWQRNYWERGNKNELVLCVGRKNGKVTWVYPFSWSDNPLVEIKARDYLLSNPLDLLAFGKFIRPEIEKHWKRKNFHDFDYIDVELSTTQMVWLFILVALANIGIAAWVVTNELKEDESNTGTRIPTDTERAIADYHRRTGSNRSW